MNAYELSEKKCKIIRTANYLHGELDSDAGTVLLSDAEVLSIIKSLEECVKIINDKLKSVQID